MHFLFDFLKQIPRLKLKPLFWIFPFILLAGCDATPEPALRLGTHPWPGYESLHLAESLGYFDQTQIRNIALANASQCAFAIRAGTVDAATMTLDEALSLMQDGIDLRVILVMDISHGADVVMAHPGIKSLQALRGKKIAVENGAVGAVMLDATLEKAGLKIDDVHLISATMNEHVQAYRSGKADVVVTFEPMRSELLKLGAHILFDSSAIPGRIVDVLVVRTNVMSQHTDALKKLIEAHFNALAYQSQYAEDAALRIAPYLGVNASDVLPQYDGLKLPSLSENYALLSGKNAELNTQATHLVQLLLQHKLLEHSVNVESLSNSMFLPKVKQ